MSCLQAWISQAWRLRWAAGWLNSTAQQNNKRCHSHTCTHTWARCAEDRLQHLMWGRVGQSMLWGEGFIPRWAVAMSDSMVCKKSIPTVTTAAYFDVCGHRLCDSTCWLHIWGLFSVSGWLSYVWRLQICLYPFPWNSLSSTTGNIQSFTPFTLLGFTTIGH